MIDAERSGPLAYTDGSCIGNPGPGGWGVHLEFPDGRVIELGGGEGRTTNNRMELRAAIEAVRATQDWPSVTIVLDSQYVRRGVTEWVVLWKRNGWLTSTKKPVENKDLWEELDALADGRIHWRWTRGHSGTPGNERVDEIARWFAASVRPLAGERARQQDALDGVQARPRAPVPTNGMRYLSLVDGIVARHGTWDECSRRVHGVRGARFKKARSADDERAIVAAWGLGPDALFGV
ncbi:MAG: ribonuclease HI [Chloroflexi bacterium]|nr:ribonuclease HI [Chloroflexota bacterium]